MEEESNINDELKATCDKCGCSEFSIRTRDDGACRYLACDICGNVIGVLDNVDLNKEFEKLQSNDDFLMKKVTYLENKLIDIENQNKHLIELVEIQSVKAKIKD